MADRSTASSISSSWNSRSSRSAQAQAQAQAQAIDRSAPSSSSSNSSPTLAVATSPTSSTPVSKLREATNDLHAPTRGATRRAPSSSASYTHTPADPNNKQARYGAVLVVIRDPHCICIPILPCLALRSMLSCPFLPASLNIEVSVGAKLPTFLCNHSQLPRPKVDSLSKSEQLLRVGLAWTGLDQSDLDANQPRGRQIDTSLPSCVHLSICLVCCLCVGLSCVYSV